MADQPVSIGDFQVLKLLGEGGFSRVYLGKKDNVPAALKVLKVERIQGNEAARKQIAAEINAMQRVQHVNVVRLHGVNEQTKYVQADGQQKQRCVMVLEYAPGGELFDLLSHTGKFDESLARTYFHQLISGIAACHHAPGGGVAHRDLKPENLLLSGNFELKIADFGFATALEGNVPAQMFSEVGTPAYMAPEIGGMGGYNAYKSDLWAAGVILFIMLSGFPPFSRPAANDWWFNKLATNRHHLFWQAHERSHQFSADAKDFINRILCPDPANRITLQQILHHRWFQGPTLQQDNLVQVMAQRLGKIRQAEAIAKHNQQQQAMARAQAQGGAAGGLVVRGGDDGVDAEDDSLPEMNPVMAIFTKKGNDNMDDDGLAEDVAADPESKPVTFDADANTRVYTRFVSDMDAVELMERVSCALDRLALDVRYTQNKKDYETSAKVVHPQGTVRFTSTVFADPSKEGRHIVEFRRAQGDSTLFRGAYNTLMSELTDLIVQ